MHPGAFGRAQCMKLTHMLVDAHGDPDEHACRRCASLSHIWCGQGRGSVLPRWRWPARASGPSAECWACLCHTGDGHRGTLQCAVPLNLLHGLNCCSPLGKMQLTGVYSHASVKLCTVRGAVLGAVVELTKSHQRHNRLSSSLCGLQPLKLLYPGIESF